MNAQERQQLETLIRSRIAESEEILAQLREQTVPVAPDVSLGRLTRMDAIAQQQMAEATLAETEDSLHKLKRALEKLRDPTFGVCRACGRAIPMERLLALPETEICVTCSAKKKR